MFKRWRLIFIKIGCVASLFSARALIHFIDADDNWNKKNVKERLIRTTQFISVWSFKRSKLLIVIYYLSREAFLTDFNILMGDEIFLFYCLGVLEMTGCWDAHATFQDKNKTRVFYFPRWDFQKDQRNFLWRIF